MAEFRIRIIPIIMLNLVSTVEQFECSIRVFERSIKVYQSFRGFEFLTAVIYVITSFLLTKHFPLAN